MERGHFDLMRRSTEEHFALGGEHRNTAALIASAYGLEN